MNFSATDGTRIAYDLYPAENAKVWLLLIHMMPATKESWRDFAERAREEGYSSIAIDLRGHGESTDVELRGQIQKLDYRKFSDIEHQKSILDLEASVEFLKKQGADPKRIVLIGASIGANLALEYLANQPEIETAILFSAGLNYRGIFAEPLVKKLSPGQKVLFFASEDDVRSGGNNAEMNKRLFALMPAGAIKELVIFQTGGHGTDLLKQAEDKIFQVLANASK